MHVQKQLPAEQSRTDNSYRHKCNGRHQQIGSKLKPFHHPFFVQQKDGKRFISSPCFKNSNWWRLPLPPIN
jgi:hypothetical protein